MNWAQHDTRSDLELVNAAVSDPEAFGAFYDRHSRRITGYFWARTRDQEATADLVAETFAAALAGVRQFDPTRGDPTRWLYGIAGNNMKRYWRTQRVAKTARRRLQMRTPPAPEQHWDFSEADARLDASRIQAALERLTGQCREVIHMRVIDRAPYSQIGAQMSTSEGAARVKVFRCLKRLRRNFDEGQPING